MSIQGRNPIHKNIGRNSKTTPTHSTQESLTNYSTLDTDDSLLSNSNSFEDLELTNDSRNVSSFKRDTRRRSTSAARNESTSVLESSRCFSRNLSSKVVTRTESPIRLETSVNYSRNGTRTESPIRRNVTRTESPISREYPRNISKVSPSKSNSSGCIWIVVSFVLLAFLAFFVNSILITESNTPDDLKRCTYSNLKSKYRQESDYLWAHLKSGIEDILNGHSDKPAVYLFVHSGGNKANELISDIAIASSSCFDPSMKPLEIPSVDFTSRDAVDDYGYVIEKYKQIIKRGNVILIANLNEIPPEAARALHAICDTVSPIVPRVMIFLSLVAEHKQERAIDTAEESLRELWGDKIIPSELDPLITRVTDEVILLQSK